MENLKLWLHLLSTPDLGRKKIRKLLDIFGDPSEFLGAQKPELRDLSFLNNLQRKHLDEFNEPVEWRKVSDLSDKFNIKYISILNSEYPTYLASIFDPPLLLFYRGDLSCLSKNPALAIVGTRRPSNYGLQMTGRIGSQLAESGFTIVSGLAYGIDSAAHNSVLDLDMKTAAVMATGPDIVYPPGNRKMAEKIINKGVILSEYFPGSKAEKWYFPTRNRIISGLCKGCVIIEGSRKSGALLTAKFALDQNRDVFALPGDISRAQSEGPNYLIKIGARPVTQISDILEEYNMIINRNNNHLPDLNDAEKNIYKILMSSKSEIGFDNLLIRSGSNVNSLSSILLSLELKSLIKKNSGNRYIVV
jgi:DNA processing protein